MKIKNRDCLGGGMKKGKRGNDRSTLNAVSENWTFGSFAR